VNRRVKITGGNPSKWHRPRHGNRVFLFTELPGIRKAACMNRLRVIYNISTPN